MVKSKGSGVNSLDTYLSFTSEICDFGHII